jgi:hypothetical protein
MRHQPRSPLRRIRAALIVLALLAIPFGAQAAMATGATGCHLAHAMQGGDGASMQASPFAAPHDCCPAQGCLAVAVLPDTATTTPGFAPHRQYLPAAPPVRAWCPAPGPPVPIPGKLT